MANRNFSSGGKIYSMHLKPVMVDCVFTVNSADSGALGITGLKGPLVAEVYMNTSAASPSAVGNPNPAAGVIVVQLQDNYNELLNIIPTIHAKGGTTSSSVSTGKPYQVVSLGTASPSQWIAAGVPAQFLTNNGLPPIGLTFIAAETSAIGGSALVAPPVTSGIDHIEIMQSAQKGMFALPPNQGAQLILLCYSGGTLTAPVDGTAIGLEILINDSSVTVQGD